ncbi:hypothetical protein [Parasitella parasitica]|uniref:Uncharacterized protein n=1 Tax=Parasitella parasitica TaxID=35722 RepID=A0A0B7N438_9FUNG|nr:hypothetical protein [Parasitella parasitica]
MALRSLDKLSDKPLLSHTIKEIEVISRDMMPPFPRKDYAPTVAKSSFILAIFALSNSKSRALQPANTNRTGTFAVSRKYFTEHATNPDHNMPYTVAEQAAGVNMVRKTKPNAMYPVSEQDLTDCAQIIMKILS